MFTNELLYKTTELFDFENPQMDPHELYNLLTDTMIKERGVGLSANQIGLPYRVFVMGDPTNRESIIPVFNPTIVYSSDDTMTLDEGCLSFPGLYIKIKRSTSIRARMTTIDGETDTATFEGFTARVFQHEYDHMEGYDFRKRANRYHLDKAMKDLRLLQRRRKQRAA